MKNFINRFKHFIRSTLSKPIYQYRLPDVKFKKYLNQDDKNNFSVLSYNILADKFTEKSRYPYCPEHCLHKDYRSKLVLEEIRSVNCDIVCLQECDYELFSGFFTEALQKMGYSIEFRLTNIKRGVTLVICYKKDKFIKKEEVQLINLDKFFIPFKDKSFNRNGQALIITLNHLNSNRNIIVCNTHLYWNPAFEYVKYGQISFLVKKLETMIDNKQYPLIFCGDMNSFPNSNVLRYIYHLSPNFDNCINNTESNKDYSQTFFMMNKFAFDFRSAYDIYKINPIESEKLNDLSYIRNNYMYNHPDFTNISNEFKGNLDYIFYSNELEVTELLEIPNDDEAILAHNIPNKNYPSDHLKIAAKFIIK